MSVFWTLRCLPSTGRTRSSDTSVSDYSHWLIHKKVCVHDMTYLFCFQSYWNRDIPHGNFRLLFGNSMVVLQTLFTNLTPLCHIHVHVCWMVCSLTVTYDWFPVILCKSWQVPHVWQELLALSGTPGLSPFGEFVVLLIRYIYMYIYIVYYWVCQFWDCLYRLMTLVCLPWIGLAALSRTYFI